MEGRLVYSVKEIQEMLGINKNAAYELIHQKEKEWNVKLVGKRILIPKSCFDQWVNKF